MKHATAVPVAVYSNVGLIVDDACDGFAPSDAATVQHETDFELYSSIAAEANSSERQQQLQQPHAQQSAVASASELTYAWTQLHPVLATPAHVSSGDHCPVGARPPGRTKHAACVHRSSLYVHGGRNGSVPLKDFWRFDFGTGSWTTIDSSHRSGDPPGHLEDHTLVSSDGDEYQCSGDNNTGSLYIFGGELSFCSKNETSLWRYDIGNRLWTKCNPPRTGSSTSAPAGRRGHTAIVHGHKMHVFGGYLDFMGSTNELWIFDFATSNWTLVHGSGGAVHVTEGRTPVGRHDHSALRCSTSMLIYGGMANLVPCYDLWQWSFNVHCWTKIHVSSLRRRAPESLQLAVQVDHRVILLSDGTDSESSNAEESHSVLWQLNTTTGVMKKWKPATAKLQSPLPAVCRCSLISIRSPSACHSTSSRQELPRLKALEKEPLSVVKLNEQWHRSFDAAGDISAAILHTLRNQIVPANAATDSATSGKHGRGAQHRVAFQNDLSIFSAFSTARSTDCLLPRAAFTRDDLFGLHNPLRWSSDLSMSSSRSARTESGCSLSHSSPSVKDAVSSDYEQLIRARRPRGRSALGDHSTGSSPLPSAPGFFTPDLPGCVWPVASSGNGDDLRAGAQHGAAAPATSAKIRLDGNSPTTNIKKSESYAHTAVKLPDARPSASYGCLAELYLVGGAAAACSQGTTAAVSSAHEGRTKQLTVWRCCILHER